MIIWILFTLLLLTSYSTSDSQYECGPHGRFEYCIDGIPGCVVGCHCHPGYYFDTDTKICEPNTKLTQDFRRHYLLEPTRIHDTPFIPPTIPNNEPATTTDPIDDKVDEITKNADDIGDWLYNQFFKTIENQVINNTKGEKLLTRRSGSSPYIKKPKRKSHKYRKRANKRKRKKGLKSKLLRITQDDSLFDSSSGSTSDEDSSSSSSSGESDTSIENYSDNTKNNKDHGHKKIVIFNKKPKPPLPSFIFLPNIETPFYPPIGLPPPPAVPMYPMVPVPPMGPMFPYQGFTPKCENDETTTATTILTTTDADTSIPTTSSSVPDTTSDSTSTTMDTGPPPILRSNKSKYGNKLKAKKSKLLTEDLSENEQEEILWNNFKQKPRNNFLQKLRQKMKKMNNKPFVDQYQEAESPLLDISTESFMSSNILQLNTEDNSAPKQGDVNFKYLTQLIHRVDTNKTNSPKLHLNLNNKILQDQLPQRRMNNFYDSNLISGYSQPSERMVDGKTSKWNEPNDSYYSNLGRQIAAMIRNIDSKGERQVNIEIEQANIRTPSNPVFIENSYAPRSYWERSVRSPIRYYNSNTDEFEIFKKSNEDLFSLENKVQIAATTARSLSLKELENIINTLGKTQSQMQRKNIHSYNLNSSKANRFSLLPEHNLIQNNNGNFIKINNRNITIKPDNLQFNNNRRSFPAIRMKKFHNLTSWTNKGMNKTEKHLNMFYNMQPTGKPNIIKEIPKDKLIKNQYMAQPLIPRIIKTQSVKFTTQKTEFKYQLNPINYRGLNSNNKKYLVEKASHPLLYPTVFKHRKQPSYFHHAVHNFDYFDE